jgi:hypothetical protein
MASFAAHRNWTLLTATSPLVVPFEAVHGVGRRAARLRAGQHEPEVGRFDVLAPTSRQWFVAMPRQVW